MGVLLNAEESLPALEFESLHHPSEGAAGVGEHGCLREASKALNQ
jgi:hypothetical protein